MRSCAARSATAGILVRQRRVRLVTRKLVVEAGRRLARQSRASARTGALVADARTGEVLAEVCAESIGTATNNVAEYLRPGGRPGAPRPSSRRAPTWRSGWIPSSSSSRCRAAGRSRTRTCARWPPAPARRRPAWERSPTPGCRGPAMPARTGSRIRPWDAANGARPGRSRVDRSRRTESEADGAEADGAGADGQAATGPFGRTGCSAQRPPQATTLVLSRPPRPAGPPRTRTPTTTLLLRHGQTPMSAERRFAGRGDIPLTETGRGARPPPPRAASRSRGGIDVIVTSPLQRPVAPVF